MIAVHVHNQILTLIGLVSVTITISTFAATIINSDGIYMWNVIKCVMNDVTYFHYKYNTVFYSSLSLLCSCNIWIFTIGLSSY